MICLKYDWLIMMSLDGAVVSFYPPVGEVYIRMRFWNFGLVPRKYLV